MLSPIARTAKRPFLPRKLFPRPPLPPEVDVTAMNVRTEETSSADFKMKSAPSLPIFPVSNASPHPPPLPLPLLPLSFSLPRNAPRTATANRVSARISSASPVQITLSVPLVSVSMANASAVHRAMIVLSALSARTVPAIPAAPMPPANQVSVSTAPAPDVSRTALVNPDNIVRTEHAQLLPSSLLLSAATQ